MKITGYILRTFVDGRWVETGRERSLDKALRLKRKTTGKVKIYRVTETLMTK